MPSLLLFFRHHLDFSYSLRCKTLISITISGLAITFLSGLSPLLAMSPLLSKVKQDPQLARRLCNKFKQLNQKGQSATSLDSVSTVAKSQNLSKVDSEVLITYVMGLHCPNIY